MAELHERVHAADAVTSATGTVCSTFPTVSGSTPFLPIPTLGASYRFGEKKEYTVALGVFAPIHAHRQLPAHGQRTARAVALLAGVARRLGPRRDRRVVRVEADGRLRIGGGVETLVGNFNSPGRLQRVPPTIWLVSAPEDPTYDAYSSLKVGPIFAPSANLGITVRAAEERRPADRRERPAPLSHRRTRDRAGAPAHRARVRQGLAAGAGRARVVQSAGVSSASAWRFAPMTALARRARLGARVLGAHSSIDITPDEHPALERDRLPEPVQRREHHHSAQLPGQRLDPARRRVHGRRSAGTRSIARPASPTRPARSRRTTCRRSPST